MFLKICGITRVEDARHAVQHGATALGFVFWTGSPRAIDPQQAREIIATVPTHVTTVGVFVNEPAAGVRQIVETTGIRAVQLHGDETPAEFAGLGRPLLRSIALDGPDEATRGWPAGTTWLLDAADPVRRGGTGRQLDWDRAARVARRYQVVLAGGLTPANVEEAIRVVGPCGVDVSSGVESAPGMKDADKVSLFLTNARRAFEGLGVS